MSERKTEGKDHKEEDDEDDIEEPDLKVRELGDGERATFDVISCISFYPLLQEYESTAPCMIRTVYARHQGCRTYRDCAQSR